MSILALFDPKASEEERFEGALLVAEFARDIYLIRSVLIRVRGEE